MKQNLELPPGWGGKSGKENPWGNTAQQTANPFLKQETKVPWSVSDSGKQTPKTDESTKNSSASSSETDVILETFLKKAVRTQKMVKQKYC